MLLTGGLLATASASSGGSGGRAAGAFANAPLLGVSPTFVVDTGEVMTLSNLSGGEGVDLPDASVPGILNAKVLTATTDVEPGLATSSTSIADVVVLAGQPAELTAAFVRAQADVLDVNGSSRWNGVTEIDGLRFAGRSIAVTGKPNQRIDLLGVGSLIINEQITSNSIEKLTAMTDRYPMDVGLEGQAPRIMRMNVANLYDYLTGTGMHERRS